MEVAESLLLLANSVRLPLPSAVLHLCSGVTLLAPLTTTRVAKRRVPPTGHPSWFGCP